MAEPAEVKLTVHSILKKECPMGLKVGDSWLMEDSKTPTGMCAALFCTAYPVIRTFRLGGEHPWDEDKDVTHVSCSDPESILILEVKRLR